MPLTVLVLAAVLAPIGAGAGQTPSVSRSIAASLKGDFLRSAFPLTRELWSASVIDAPASASGVVGGGNVKFMR